jgi:hypothetical protein
MIALFLSLVERLNVVTLWPTILYVPPLRCTVWPVNYTPTPMESKGLIACLILYTAFYCTSLASDISSYVAVQSLTRVPCWCSALGVLVWESRVGAGMGVETTVKITPINASSKRGVQCLYTCLKCGLLCYLPATALIGPLEASSHLQWALAPHHLLR